MKDVISEPQWNFSSMKIETNETLLPAEKLEREIIKRATTAYNTQKNGEIIFKFKRFFFLASKPD